MAGAEPSQGELVRRACDLRLEELGLTSFGWFATDDEKVGLLIGNAGSALWPAFSTSEEYHDSAPDSLDRWTVRVLGPLAKAFEAQLRFPFGETVWPFQHYARVATGMRPSPLGLLIHPEFGLWTAFRAALMFDAEKIGAANQHEVGASAVHPCDQCEDKPCLSTCPVGAFSAQGYDYVSCRTHVRSGEHKDGTMACGDAGCLARHACPIGREFAYQTVHQQFHMKAFSGN